CNGARDSMVSRGLLAAPVGCFSHAPAEQERSVARSAYEDTPYLSEHYFYYAIHRRCNFARYVFAIRCGYHGFGDGFVVESGQAQQ
ncbi:MAG: hypothetical protein ACRD8U_20570, partial [Pyrinomonadaceae bacterium]